MTLPFLVSGQIAVSFIPSFFQFVPHKSKIIELLATFGCKIILLRPLKTHPSPKRKAILFMARWNAAMTFTVLITPQIAETFIPICFKYIPNETKIVESLATFV
jgi:hypothetical protein